MKIIAFYLPQFHPIPENNEWWSSGFTEWTNIARARPLFLGHNQPTIPGELGFYDLRLGETRQQQADLAKLYGIGGFCYYHYWFSGKLLLQRPVEEMLKNGCPNIDFCLCWANESWTANWVGKPNNVLIEQTYPGLSDHEKHLEYLAPFFNDSRYIQIDEKPIFLFHKPLGFKDTNRELDLLRNISKKITGKDLYFLGVGNEVDEILMHGYDGVVTYSLRSALNDYLTIPRKIAQEIKHKLLRMPRWVISYQDLLPFMIREEWKKGNVFPDVLPNWDNSPRLGRRALILSNPNPNLFEGLLKVACDNVKSRKLDQQLIFLKSWNEWAEGNYVEPDLKFGRAFLEAINRVVQVSK